MNDAHQVVLLPAVVVGGEGDAGVGDTRLLSQAHLHHHHTNQCSTVYNIQSTSEFFNAPLQP
jgi:hypothetical protein